VAREDDAFIDQGEQDERKATSRVRTLVLPLAVLVVVVAILSGLVLGGVVQGHEPRVSPEHAPTTQPTVEIAP
jgi:hypothetical protein